MLRTIKRRTDKKNISELSKAIEHFKITSMVFGGLLVILWLLLPSTAVLRTFGYPENLSAIEGEAKVLALFQRYNLAIVRTGEVVQWFLFLFVWWFLTTLHSVAGIYKQAKEKSFPQQPAL
jgi:hypothetical protein